MRGNELLDKMELVDPAYIEAADAAPKVRRTVWTGWRAAMAACLCVVLLAGTAMAVSGGRTWLVEMFGGRGSGETGYELGVDMDIIPTSRMSENLQGVSEEIVRQFETTTPSSSWLPGHWMEKNLSVDEAWEFIGLESLRKPDWDLEVWYNTLNVYGDSSGRIESILIDTGYREGDISLQAWAQIKTENFEGEQHFRSITEPGVRFTETFLTTPGGNNCQVISSSANERGWLGLTGYLVENSVLYQLYVSYQEPDAARAEELLHQWADQF